MGGNYKGGRIDVGGEVTKMLDHQLKIGNLKSGDSVYVKLGGDGTMITKKDCCTAHTITISSEERALQISTIAMVMGSETYEVQTHNNF